MERIERRFASMFRHFAQDPDPAELMRRRAPGVHEWQARLWNARASRMQGELLRGVPDDWSPILDEIGSAYLPFPYANARAWQEGERRYDPDGRSRSTVALSTTTTYEPTNPLKTHVNSASWKI